ncbi:polysaccharide lyase [Azospirillum halopraeferens]|uniref:polysaccharide lyase n=1 Tax=Azospirillum halopraeferens TaxID=34010 RepID=UPI000406828A|nr:polysaccharide lyase [Azospirillum halopraeferens]
MSNRRTSMRKAMLATLPVLAILVECSVAAAGDRRGLLFEADFERGSDLAALGFRHSGNPSAIARVAGERAVRVHLDRLAAGGNGYRSEIQPVALPAPAFDQGMFARIGKEYWYGMRLYMPEDWRVRDRSTTILVQFHSAPDPGEAWRNPPVSLRTALRDGRTHFMLHVRSDSSRYTTGSGEARYDRSDSIDLGPIDSAVGTWTDWVWNIRWNHDGNGFLRLYRNGRLVADVAGGNSFNDRTGPYLKLGLYKFDWKDRRDTGPSSRTLYIDDLRVGDAAAGYDGVAPRPAAAGRS